MVIFLHQPNTFFAVKRYPLKWILVLCSILCTFISHVRIHMSAGQGPADRKGKPYLEQVLILVQLNLLPHQGNNGRVL